MDFWNFPKLLRELRLMETQPGYRFVLVWTLIALRLGLLYLVLPAGGFLVLRRLIEFLR